MLSLELVCWFHWFPISIFSIAIIGNWSHEPAWLRERYASFASTSEKVAAKSRQQIDRWVRGRGCPPHVIHRSHYVDFSRHDYLPAIGSRPRRWHCWRAASRFSASLKLRRCLRSPHDGSTSADAGNFSRFWSRFSAWRGEREAWSMAVIIARPLKKRGVLMHMGSTW